MYSLYMEFTTTEREAEMLYTMRVDFADETFEVTEVQADSLIEADAICRRDPEVVSVTCLCMFDTTPQRCLAW